MALRYNQFKNDHNAIGTIITWAGNSVPNGYLQCDGTTYTITGVSNVRYRGLASVVAGQYSGSDTYPYGDLNGTGTFTVPNMSPDDVVVQRNSETLGSRGGNTSSSFGGTALNASQWPRHRHNLPRQNYNLTNNVNVTRQPNHWGAVVNSPRCWDGRACMSYRILIRRGRWRRWIQSPCPTRYGGWWSSGNYTPCARPGSTSYGPRDAGSALGMGPRTNFSYNMGNAGANSPSSHTHSANPIQQSMRMQFLIKAF